jgi:HK97 family phage prohead protease
MDGEFNFYMPFSKVEKGDDGSRIVTGYASTPTKDLDGEIVSIDAVKAAVPAYMEWRNLRLMHQPIAIGTTKEAHVDNKGLYITGKIVDPDAINLLDHEVLKGFSIGGKKLTKKGDVITAIELIEISLVDRPANPDCRIDAVKMAKGLVLGATEEEESETSFLRKMVSKLMNSVSSPRTEPTALVDDPYGDAEYVKLCKRDFSTAQRKEAEEKGHAMPGGGYPIENEHDVKNAVQAFGRAKNPEATKKHIIQQAKRLGATHLLPADWEGSSQTEKSVMVNFLKEVDQEAFEWKHLGLLAKAAPTMLQIPTEVGDRLAKGLGTVADLAYAFSSIRQCQRRLLVEGAIEKDGDDAALAQRLGHVAAELASVISEKAEHEASEALYLTDADDLTSYMLGEKEVAIMSLSSSTSDLAKRASKAARGHMAKAAHHLHKAAEAHMAGMKCMGKAAKMCAAAEEDTEKAAKDGFSHAAVMGHLEKAHGHFAEAADHMDLANHHMEKSADVTAPGPGANTEGLSSISQSHMTEGEVPWYEADEPYRAGARVQVGNGMMTAAQVDAMVKAAIAETKAGLLEKQVGDLTTLLNRTPATPRKAAVMQAFDKGAIIEEGANGKQPSRAALLLDGVELTEQMDPASRRKAAAHMIQNMIDNRGTFAKSLFDPEFRGAAGLKRASV